MNYCISFQKASNGRATTEGLMQNSFSIYVAANPGSPVSREVPLHLKQVAIAGTIREEAKPRSAVVVPSAAIQVFLDSIAAIVKSFSIRMHCGCFL